MGSLISVWVYQYLYYGYVETHAVLYPAFSILSKNFYWNTVNEQQAQHHPVIRMDAGCWKWDVCFWLRRTTALGLRCKRDSSFRFATFWTTLTMVAQPLRPYGLLVKRSGKRRLLINNPASSIWHPASIQISAHWNILSSTRIPHKSSSHSYQCSFLRISL